jgi:hypothetical protein
MATPLYPPFARGEKGGRLVRFRPGLLEENETWFAAIRLNRYVRVSFGAVA